MSLDYYVVLNEFAQAIIQWLIFLKIKFLFANQLRSVCNVTRDSTLQAMKHFFIQLRHSRK